VGGDFGTGFSEETLGNKGKERNRTAGMYFCGKF
jgi:hypothetical protein